MEECKLTKRPCRAAIKESVDKCKNPIKHVDDVEYKELSKGDYDRVILICDVMHLEDKDVGYLRSCCRGLEEARRERKAGK